MISESSNFGKEVVLWNDLCTFLHVFIVTIAEPSWLTFSSRLGIASSSHTHFPSESSQIIRSSAGRT